MSENKATTELHCNCMIRPNNKSIQTKYIECI